MSLNHSPSVVTNGLVLYTDMSNKQKSWKGKPTVNLIANAGADAAVERSGVGYAYFSQDITAYVLANWSASNNALSMSFEGKRQYSVGGTGGGNDGYPSMYIYFTDWSWASSFGISTYDWSYNTQNNIIMPNPAGKGIAFSIYHMNAGNPGFSYSRNHQVEFNSFATSFVNGTRSNTQAIVDLTGNNTLTASSLTYASDNTFSFNGSNDKITLNTNTLISGTSNYTIDVAFKTSAAGTDYIFGNYGTTAGAGGGLEYYVWQSKLNNYIAGNTQSGTTLNLNQWYIASVTRSGSTITHYLNGVADGSNTNAASISATNPFTIGNGHDYTSEAFGGTIGVIKVYNRALSAAEVKQNFQALRGRYGI